MNAVEGSAQAIATEWLAEMQSCVRGVDFARGRAIFADDVVGFGTKAAVAVGLDNLERDQWRHIWGNIRNFTFVTAELRSARYGDEAIWLGCPWTSEAPGPDGAWLHRPGRITAVLEWRNGRWLAVHTHHSVVPGTPAPPVQPAL